MTAYVPGSGNATMEQVVRSLKEQASGRSNATGMVTLRVSQTTTVVNDANFVAGSAVLLCPTTANARTAQANIYFDLSSQGAFTIHHASNSATDMTFVYVIVG
jgi:hypothetical protein